MGDLIWIGNTLYPRGFVIAVVAAIFIAPFIIAAIVSAFSGRDEK